MTWVAIMISTVMEDSISEDGPGEVMLYLMRYHPEYIQRDYVGWLGMRDTRGETAVRALFNPAIADALKEGYLDFVTSYAVDVGYYDLGNGLSIRDIGESAENVES